MILGHEYNPFLRTGPGPAGEHVTHPVDHSRNAQRAQGFRWKGHGWKLQRWRNGRNETRYIPAEQIEKVREGTRGCAQFMPLAQQYVEAKGQQALSALNTPTDSKKKPMKR